MTSTLVRMCRGIGIAPALLAAAALLCITSAKAGTSQDVPQWDEKASQELMMALHHSHDVANAGDIEALKRAYIGDNGLVTFELSPDNATPIALRSKKDIDAHLGAVNAGISAQGTLNLDHPKMKCRATDTFGVCTEECTVRLMKPDGTEQVDHFFGSGTAVKIGGEWKWVQWHMSVGAPREKFEAASAVRHQ